MATIRFDNGPTVNFQGNPTKEDIAAVAARINTPAAAPPERPKTFLDKAFGVVDAVSDGLSYVFPGKKVGEAIGTAYVAGKQALKGNTDIAANIADTGPKPLQVAGDIAAGAASVAGFKGVGSTGGILSKALQSAGLGAVMGGGNAAAEGGGAGDIATGAAIGGAVGGGTSLAFSGAEAALKNISKNLPERLIRSATGQTKKDILAGKDVSKYVLENKKIGTADQLIRGSQDAIDQADDFINRSLSSASQNIDDTSLKTINRHLQEAQDVVAAKLPHFESLGGTKGLIARLKENIASGLQAEGKDAASTAVRNLDDTLFSSVDDFAAAARERVSATNGVPVKDIITDIADSINAAGGEIDEAGVRSTLESLAPQVKKILSADYLPLDKANQLRSQLDKVLGSRAFINSQLPFNKGLLMDFTQAVREQVKGRAPEGVRGAFETLSNEIRFRDAIASKAAGASRNQVIGLGDLITGSGGFAVGGVPGALAGAGVKRVVESTIFKTATAQLVSKLDQTLSPVLEGLAPATQTAIISALVQAFNESPTKSQ